MSYVTLASQLLVAFAVGHMLGWLRARAVIQRIREAKARGLVPELSLPPVIGDLGHTADKVVRHVVYVDSKARTLKLGQRDSHVADTPELSWSAVRLLKNEVG